MKKFLSLFALLAGFTNAHAKLVFSDGFTYPDGNLVGAPGSPWNAHSGAGNGPVVVQAGAIEVSRSRAEDVNANLPGGPFASGGPTTMLYAGFSVRFTALPTTTGSYFAHFGSSNMRGRVWASIANATAGGFRLGIGNSSTADAASGQIATDLALNTDYSIVVRYVLATGVSSIWLNPSVETDPSVTAADAPGASLPSIAAFSFRQNNGMGIMLIDNLIIGTAFADVVGGNLPPTISPVTTQSIPRNGNTGALGFAVGDDHTPAGSLTLSGSSDNQSLVPDGNIAFGGSGGSRTVIVTPIVGQQGQANITMTVSDGSTTAATSFLLKVGAPTVNPVANQITPMNTVLGPLVFTIADAEEGAGALVVTATSSNQLLLPANNFGLGGSGGSRTLTLVPANGETGLTTVTITADDGHQTAATSFLLTVHPVLGLMISDDFNRANASLVDEVVWFNHSGFFGETEIVGNRLALSQHLIEDVSHRLDGGTILPIEGGYVFFASFVANFSELPAGAGTYFAHFKDDAFRFKARIAATTAGASAGTLRLGISSESDSTAPESRHPTELNLDTDYLVVIRLNAATGESRLWVNPTAEASGFVNSTDAPLGAPVQSFAFRQSGPSNGMGVLTVDDLKVGTAFSDVVSNLPVLLGFTVNNQTIRLSWPAGQGYSLRRATSLPAAPANWSNVPFINEGANDVSNLDVATGNGFFRLEKSN